MCSKDDGLDVSPHSPKENEEIEKKLCKIFKDNALNLTVIANVQNVNFLDINLNLSTGIFKPYMKENDKPIYVHCESNHPHGILRNITKSVNKRFNSISAIQEVFQAAIPPTAIPRSTTKELL